MDRAEEFEFATYDANYMGSGAGWWDNLKRSPTVFVFDIKCIKALMKFTDTKFILIFMILYVVDGQGYLLLSWNVVGKNVPNF